MPANTTTVTITDEQKRLFVEQGYFLLERVLPADHLELVRSELGYYMDQIHAEMDRAGTDVIGINHRNSRYFISNKYKETGRLKPYMFSQYMAEICRATLGPDAYLFNEQYVVKAAEKGMKFAWHQDSGYIGHPHRPYLSCWVALDDMSEANGTVYMLPYSRAGGRDRVEHVKEAVSNDLVGYHGSDPGDPVICPAGSIAVFSSTCFHRSGTNTTKTMRRVHLAQYSAEPIMTKEGDKLWGMAEPLLKNGVYVGW
jgi:ectoine hydroxylase-related dioxygenase (phytanoyl-CoA dioxygenase family)